MPIWQHWNVPGERVYFEKIPMETGQVSSGILSAFLPAYLPGSMPACPSFQAHCSSAAQAPRASMLLAPRQLVWQSQGTHGFKFSELLGSPTGGLPWLWPAQGASETFPKGQNEMSFWLLSKWNFGMIVLREISFLVPLLNNFNCFGISCGMGISVSTQLYYLLFIFQ